MALRYLFIDFDSFYASVEQAYAPNLRGQPVAVVPSLNVDTTSCIAASYEAKALGIKTGTSVREARALCPKINFVQAKHEKYVAIHNKIHKIPETRQMKISHNSDQNTDKGSTRKRCRSKIR